MGELGVLKTHLSDSDELGRRLSKQVSGEIGNIRSKLKDLEEAQLGSVPQESMGEAAAAFMANLNSKISEMQSELNELKVGQVKTVVAYTTSLKI